MCVPFKLSAETAARLSKPTQAAAINSDTIGYNEATSSSAAALLNVFNRTGLLKNLRIFAPITAQAPRPDIWLGLILADLPILIAAVRDRIIYGRVHPVWAIFGTLLIAEQTLETMVLFETTLWRDLGAGIYKLLSPDLK